MDTFVTHPLKLNVILHCTWHETCSQMVDSSVIHIWHKNGRLLIFRTPLCCSFVSFSGSLPLEILPAFPHLPSLAISVALRFGFRILAQIVWFSLRWQQLGFLRLLPYDFLCLLLSQPVLLWLIWFDSEATDLAPVHALLHCSIARLRLLDSALILKVHFLFAQSIWCFESADWHPLLPSLTLFVSIRIVNDQPHANWIFHWT